MIDLTLAIGGAALCLVLLLLWWWHQRPSSQPRLGSAQEGEPEDNEVGDSVDGDEGEDDGGDAAATQPRHSRMTMAERRRLEREARRQAAEAAAEERRKKREEAETRAQARDEAEKSKELLQAEALAKLRAEATAARRMEYEAWKGLLSVEGTGTQAAASDEEIAAAKLAQLDSVLSAVQASKVAVLDDVARDLRMSVDDVVAAIEELQATERLIGVFDDRGKYVAVTERELSDVARFVRLRGRVSTAELVRECNRIMGAD